MPADSTLLIDRDADRYLLIDRTGAIVATMPFPESMAMAGKYVRGADQAGRLYFQTRELPAGPDASRTTAVLRWDRKSIRFDSVAAVQLAHAVVKSAYFGEHGRVTGMLRTPFTPADAWMVAPDASIAVVHATPYRVEWFKGPGLPVIVGGTVPYTPVAVTDGDRKLTEPAGPPFRRTYPATKPAFDNDAVVLDDKARLWVGRNVRSGSPARAWDVFDSRAKHLGTVSVPTSKRIMAVSARFVYVLWTDDDDVQWLQAYSW